MTNVLTLDHLKGLRDLLMTKSDDDLARMRRCLLQNVGYISHKIQAGDVQIATQMVSGAFPGMHIDPAIIGGASDESLSKVWKVIKIIVLVALIFAVVYGVAKVGIDYSTGSAVGSVMGSLMADNDSIKLLELDIELCEDFEASNDASLFRGIKRLSPSISKILDDQNIDVGFCLDKMQERAMGELPRITKSSGISNVYLDNTRDVLQMKLVIAGIGMPRSSRTIELKNRVLEKKFLHIFAKKHSNDAKKTITRYKKDLTSELEEYLNRANPDILKVLHEYTPEGFDAVRSILCDPAHSRVVQNYIKRNIRTIKNNARDVKSGMTRDIRAAFDLMGSTLDDLCKITFPDKSEPIFANCPILIGLSRYFASMSFGVVWPDVTD